MSLSRAVVSSLRRPFSWPAVRSRSHLYADGRCLWTQISVGSFGDILTKDAAPHHAALSAMRWQRRHSVCDSYRRHVWGIQYHVAAVYRPKPTYAYKRLYVELIIIHEHRGSCRWLRWNAEIFKRKIWSQGYLQTLHFGCSIQTTVCGISRRHSVARNYSVSVQDGNSNYVFTISLCYLRYF